MTAPPDYQRIEDWKIRRVEVLAAHYRWDAGNEKNGSFKQSEALAYAESLDAVLAAVKDSAPAGSGEGWQPDCNICRKSQHAKWHESSKGEIINPLVLLDFIEHLPRTAETIRAFNWIALIAGIDRRLVAAPPVASPAEPEPTDAEKIQENTLAILRQQSKAPTGGER